MKAPFAWDTHSDQPALLTDRAYKQAMRQREFVAQIKTAATALWTLPISMMLMPFLKAEPRLGRDFYGMGVNLDKGEAQFELLAELGVHHVLVRVPLFDLERLADYVEFIAKWRAQGKTVLVNVLQDREHIDDMALLEVDLRRVFECLAPYADEFQIGNAINRTKWGFFSVDEYLRFFAVAQTLRDRSFPSLRLLGPAVIDFEYHYTARALFNHHTVRFDRISSLLYVDRRGAPGNTQMGIFDPRRKIALLYALAWLSPKVVNPVAYITEVGWPLQGTAPYAPTSEKECVSPDAYARFMQDYHTIAAASGKVARVYWHQLIAPGYGLVDDRKGIIRKYPAFDAYRDMVTQSFLN